MGLVDLNERLVPGTYSREKDDVRLTACRNTGRPLGQFWRGRLSGLTRDTHADDAPVKDVDAVVTEDDTFELGAAPVVDTDGYGWQNCRVVRIQETVASNLKTMIFLPRAPWHPW